MNIRRVKVMRVVTAPEAVTFHLRNTLEYIAQDFQTVVVGSGVTRFASEYPQIEWVDIDIPRSISLYKDLKSVMSLYKLVKRHKPDILHSIMPKAGLVSAIAGFLAQTQVRIHTFTGQVWVNKSGLGRFFLKSLDKLVVILSTHVFTDSTSQSQFLFENGIKSHGKLLPVLGGGSLAGVNTEKFNRDRLEKAREQFRIEHKLSANSILFSFVGRKCRDKGVFELLSSFAKVAETSSNVYLLLVGPDESNGQLEASIENLGELRSRVINIGIVGNVEEYLVASDVFCLPSYREGFGTVVLEAAALKIPTIGTRINGLIDSVEDGMTGILVTPQSVDALAESMGKMANDSALICKMGAQAYLRVKKNFDAKMVYGNLADFYRRAVSLVK